MAITAVTDISGLVLDLDPHVEAYEDAGGTTAATVGGDVGNVPDQTASGDDATQSTASQKPHLTEDANGWNYLDFDGTDDVLRVAALNTSQPYTLVFVLQLDANLGVNQYFASSAAGGNFDPAIRELNGTWEMRGSGSVISQSGSTTNRTVFTSVWNGASSVLSANDTETSGDVGAATYSDFLIGARLTAGNDAAACRVYRVLNYNKALTSTERTDLYNYLDGLYSSAPGGGTTEVSGALTLGGISLSGAAEREAALSASLTLAQLAATGQIDREADLSGALTLGGLSASGTLAGATQLQGALTLGQLSASGQLDREAALTGALTLGELAIAGQAAREADLASSLTLPGLSLTGTVGVPELNVSAALTLGQLSLSGDIDVQIALSASLTLAQLGAGGTVSREAALQAALTLGQLQVSGVLGEQPILKTLELTLSDIMTLSPTLSDAYSLETTLTD